jgi:hypothetical protein
VNIKATEEPKCARRYLLLINSWLDSRNGKLSFLIATAIIYTLAYLGHGVLPGNSEYPKAWWGWWDQGQYLKSAASLAHGTLTSDTDWYPLGYPAMGALFYRFAPQHAFFLPDLILVLGITALFYRIARQLISPLETVLIIAVFIGCYSGSLSASLVVPWNTIPTHLLSYAIIWLVAFSEPDRKRVLIAAVCLGLMYLCRYPDALCMILPLGVAIMRLPTRREKVEAALWAFGILACVMVSVLLVNHAVFGSWQTPYEKISAAVGFASYPLLQKSFLLLVDGNPVFRERDSALLQHFPWLLLLIPGAIHLLRRYKVNGLGILLSIALSYGLYFEYNDSAPDNIFRYHVIHYLFWTFPLLALITYVGLKEAWKYRVGRWSFCSVPLLLFAVCFITLREEVTSEIPADAAAMIQISSGPNQPTDWIEFVGSRIIPPLSAQGNRLVELREFRNPWGNEATVWLSTSVRSRAISFDPQKAQGLRSLRLGRLSWQIGWAPQWAEAILIKGDRTPDKLESSLSSEELARREDAAKLAVRIEWLPSFSGWENAPGKRFRWCGRKGTILFVNDSNGPRLIDVTGKLQQFSPGSSNLFAEREGQERQFVLSADPVEFHDRFVLQPHSFEEIRMRFDGPLLVVRSETRELAFQAIDFQWEAKEQ